MMDDQRADVFCSTCNIMVSAKIVGTGSGPPDIESVGLVDPSDAEYHQALYSVALCPRCGNPFLIRTQVYGIPGEFETITDTTVLFPVSQASKLGELPSSIGNSMDQAQRSFATASYDAATLMCRRALEALCKEMSAVGPNLERRLENLHSRGHISPTILKWAHGVRLLGNEAAHDVDSPVSAQDARDILDFTEALLLYVFALDKKFQAFEARRTGAKLPSPKESGLTSGST